MRENEMIEGRICDLLSLGNGVLAVGVVVAALPSFSEAEICCALVGLCEKEIVFIDGAGVHLKEAGADAAGDASDAAAESTPKSASEGAPEDAVTDVPESAVEGSSESAFESASEDAPRGAADAPELVSGGSDALEMSDDRERPVSPIPPLGEKEELLGSSIEPDYSDTYLSDDEIDAMLVQMGYGTRRSARAGDGSRPVDAPSEKLSTADPLVASSSVKRLNLKARAANYCSRAGIRHVEYLVRALPTLSEVRGLGLGSIREMRAMLERAARTLPVPVSEGQMSALRWLSGSREFVFDAFGVLCVAGERGREEGALAGPGEGDGEDLPPAVGSGFLSPQQFCGDYSHEARELVDRLKERAHARALPVNDEALRVMLLPWAEKALAECAGDPERPEALLSQLIDELETDEHALIACACDLRRRARKLVKGANKGDAAWCMTVPEGQCWTTAAQQVAAEDDVLSFDPATRLLSVRLATLESWLETLKATHAQALSLRLGGATLEQAGNMLGVTRERVRQITAKALGKRPALEEDRYRRLFDAYEVTKAQFCAVTGERGEVYEYLDLTKAKGLDRRPLEEALDDAALDDSIREAIQGVVDEGFVYIDGQRVALRRKPVIGALLRSHAREACISLDELLALYRDFTEKHGMDDTEVFEGSGPRAMAANLDRWEFAMQSSAPKDADGVRRDIRYYDWEAQDFAPLREALVAFVAEHDGMECSTALLMRDERVREAARALDVRSEYELHCVLRRTMGEADFMTLKKRPMVQFGCADRNRQVLELIGELGSADAYELAAAYEERYGVAEATFRGSFLKDFASYEHDGRYAMADAELTSAQYAFAETVLHGRPYVTLAEARGRFEEAFPDEPAPVLGSRNLRPLGYGIAGSLLVREDADLAGLFGAIMDSREAFGIDDADLGRDVFRNEVFKSELNKRIRAFQIVEYKPDHFVLTSVFARMGSSVTTEDLRDFVDAAIEFMEPGRPYSVKSLRKAGFAHPVFDLGDVVALAGDFFFGSLIATGYVGDRVKMTSCNGTSFFGRRSGQLSMPDVVAWEAGHMDMATEDALLERLADEHGVEMARPLLRALLKRADVRLGGGAAVGEAADALGSARESGPADLAAADFFPNGN